MVEIHENFNFFNNRRNVVAVSLYINDSTKEYFLHPPLGPMRSHISIINIPNIFKIEDFVYESWTIEKGTFFSFLNKMLPKYTRITNPFNSVKKQNPFLVSWVSNYKTIKLSRNN